MVLESLSMDLTFYIYIIVSIEGDFRRSCEVTMKVLHSKRDLLVNVLQSFINDPLVEWEKTGSLSVQDMAFLHLQKLENKLRGQVFSFFINI